MKDLILFSLLLTLTSVLVMGQRRAGENSSTQTIDVFDTLQENVWYLPTKDGKARLYVKEHSAPAEFI